MAKSKTASKKNKKPTPNPRRSFLAVLTGALATVTPLAVGVASFLTPLFRKRETAKVRVALLDQVPADGLPRYFPVIADREDAWNRYPGQRIGAIYLVRNSGETTPIAFSAKCPHAGCFIGYELGQELFQCPCHTSAFHLDGSRVNGDAEVSPRDMDPLPVELREVEIEGGQKATEVLVEFIDYQTGHKERIPSA